MTKTKKQDTSHCVMKSGGFWACNHCGAQEKATTPASIPDFVAEGKAFIEKHINCKKPEQAKLI